MFRFRLQRVLQLREQHEQARARELAAARDASDRAMSAEAELQSMRANSKLEIRHATDGGSRIGYLSRLDEALSSLEERLVVACDAVKEADADVHQARLLLEEAARDRRVLDRLKSHHADAWRSEQAHQDRMRMDEVALIQYARKRGGQTGGDRDTTSAEDSGGASA